MPISPRENLLRTLRCDGPEWIPLCPYLFPNENPTDGVPPHLQDAFGSSGGSLARAILQLAEHLGAEECMLPVPAPAALVTDTCSVKSETISESRTVSILTTPKGELRQTQERREGFPPMVTERYMKTAGDAVALTEFFASQYVKPNPAALESIRDARAALGDKGILFCRNMGTPLGMCYRVYTEITDLVYLIADSPEVVKALFDCMEDKYFQLYQAMLEAAPEIDAFFGMDDTSTTLISPAMFDAYNVDLTNRRADLCHDHGKLYFHHSCGLIRDLLPIYAKTRMDGVDAFTPPPIGNVTCAEGRKRLGPRYSIHSSLASGLPSLREAAIRDHVAKRFADAQAAGNVALSIGGASLTFSALEQIFAQGERLKRARA